MLISRDGIKAGDDGLERSYTEEETLGTYDLIKYLKPEGFFPKVTRDAIWSIHYEGEEFGYYKPGMGIYHFEPFKMKRISAEDHGHIHFKFFPGGYERAEYLFRFYCGNKKDMYFGGHMDEYQGYYIPNQTELQWQQDLMAENIYQPFDETEHIREAVSFLKFIMVRPGMYVGHNRLDMVKIFFDGWCRHQKSLWNINYDLERWMLFKESVCCDGSINGWNLFIETYGVAEAAMIKFKEFLENNIPTSICLTGRNNTVNEHISKIWFSAAHPEGPIPRTIPYLDFIVSETATQEEIALELVRQIKRIIGRDCNQIKVYMNTGRVVLQVRFIFDDGSGWKDSVSLIDTHDYYEKMVVLNAYVKLALLKNPMAGIVTVDWNQEKTQTFISQYQRPEFSFSYGYTPQEEFLISRQYSEWKENAMNI